VRDEGQIEHPSPGRSLLNLRLQAGSSIWTVLA